MSRCRRTTSRFCYSAKIGQSNSAMQVADALLADLELHNVAIRIDTADLAVGLAEVEVAARRSGDERGNHLLGAMIRDEISTRSHSIDHVILRNSHPKIAVCAGGESQRLTARNRILFEAALQIHFSDLRRAKFGEIDT